MPINISFTICDEDLNRFRTLVARVKESLDKEENVKRIEDAAAELMEKAREKDLPQFVEERLLKLEILLNMVKDEDWQLDENERKAILGALAYFSEGDDLISDQIPALGFLDDALYTELILDELEDEMRTYNEFCHFRIAEENRRRNRGLDPKVGREDWLADKRAALHSRMRDRRVGREATPQRWCVGLFS